MTNQNKNILHMPVRADSEYIDEQEKDGELASVTDMTQHRARKFANVAFLPIRDSEAAPQRTHLAEVRDFLKHPRAPHRPEAA